MLSSPDTVVVVHIHLDEPAMPVELDEQERRRAERFMFAKVRRRFIAAHAATRAVLGRVLDMDPAALRFEIGYQGKPRLVDAPVDVRFNLSHSGERAVLALTRGREVGVDIEQTRAVATSFKIAQRVFSPAERERLQQAPVAQQHEVFFRMWTRKESFIKAKGVGLSFPLAGLDVSAEPEGAQLLLACASDPEAPQQWTMRAVSCEPTYLAAVTVQGNGFDVVSMTLPETLEQIPAS